jgi:hypothetical protein
MLRVPAVVTCVTIAVVGNVGAQVLQPWSEPTARSVTLDALRPAFDGGGTTALTTIDQLAVRWGIGSVVLVGELPFVIAKADGAPSGAFLVGNPYLGAATAPTSSFIGEIGFRIPVVSASTPERGFAALVGVLGDFQDLEAYGEDVLSIRATAGYRFRAANHSILRVALRPMLLSPVGNNSGDSELFLDYGIQGGYETDQASVGLSFTGRALLTEPGSIGERTIHDVALGGSMAFGRIRPGVLIRLPLEHDLGDVLSYSVGLTLQMTF